MIKITDFIPYGLQNAISQEELAARTGFDHRTIRKLVLNARLAGELICSTCDGDNGGYYLPADQNEAIIYYRNQTSRIETAKAALKPVADYIGGADHEGK